MRRTATITATALAAALILTGCADDHDGKDCRKKKTATAQLIPAKGTSGGTGGSKSNGGGSKPKGTKPNNPAPNPAPAPIPNHTTPTNKDHKC